MSDINQYIDTAAAAYMRAVISEAGGNEVFFLGACGKDRRLARATVVARGDEASVPAVAQDAAVGDVVIHNHPAGDLTPSGADLDVAAGLGSRGVGFFIVDNDVKNVYAVVEPFAKEAIKPIDEGYVKAALSYTGALHDVMENFEQRDGQVEMALEVTRAFNEDRVAALEAGTGVGKSMAYLVPALRWALDNRERVVISTNTINLQEQLIGKDIPLLAKAFPVQFKAVLVKGRGNYLCLRKLEMAQQEGDLLLDTPDKETLASVAEWAARTKEGSRSDLNFVPGEPLWEKVNAEADTCTRLKCPYFTRCFFFRARREAASADLLVVNHHILLADIALRPASGGTSETAILPGYSRLIIDEGHNLEAGATSYFGSRVSRFGLLKALGRLHRKRERERGLLPCLVKALRGAVELPRERLEALVAQVTGGIRPARESAAARVNEAFDLLYDFAGGAKAGESGELKVRLKDELKEKAGWGDVEDAFDRLCRELKHLGDMLGKLCRELDAQEGLRDRLASVLVELKASAERLEDSAATAGMIMGGEAVGQVRWIEAPLRRAGQVISLCSSPLSVAADMDERIYGRLRTVVITSATLTVMHAFDYIAKRIGLDRLGPERLTAAVLPSPFDYDRQMIICVPTDIPPPTEQAFTRVVIDLVREALEVTKGRAFVLFTSYAMLNAVFREVQLDLVSEGIKGLRQGDAPRHKLLEEFKKNRSSALFGTDSFWEGVDVAGEKLSNVIIARLPFAVPDDPIIEARQEEILRTGGNPFMEYIVPQAVIKFRQGFGRLIRTKTDRGCILVLDNRVVEKNYGELFLKSLPEGRVFAGPRHVVFERVQEFFTPEMF